jgi:dTDP-4-dehydrorhamnose 3,5-epimerase
VSLFAVINEHFGGAVKVIAPTMFPDMRGYFSPAYREDEFAALGIPDKFVQDNYSYSRANVLRGLHFQPGMGKLMRVTRGKAFMVAVDLRQDSPTYLQWHGLDVSELNMLQVWAPSTFARGFYTYSDPTVVQYKCTAYFDGALDSAIRYDDPRICVQWPKTHCPLISERDKNAPWIGD